MRLVQVPNPLKTYSEYELSSPVKRHTVHCRQMPQRAGKQSHLVIHAGWDSMVFAAHPCKLLALYYGGCTQKVSRSPKIRLECFIQHA